MYTSYRGLKLNLVFDGLELFRWTSLVPCERIDSDVLPSPLLSWKEGQVKAIRGPGSEAPTNRGPLLRKSELASPPIAYRQRLLFYCVLFLL